ncbi:ARF GTPase-activating protein Git-like [Harmonia axyridis]|uniref:ARF GTPase-activating protein Git-like n=1 Tax=Harmonia axyridis TaxID=115357 RepID=UPI001E277CDE|nr:ARF GTPase-activating protein Git-like [Harmonia axyridis]
MSRKNYTQNVEVCGDCGSSEATWASLNKGILLCTQCCSVHRSLGRHISQVKSLQKSQWPGKQMNMLMTLVNNGVNSIWEHILLENGSKMMKKKPNPRDSLEVKSEFIKSKHQMCSFALRQTFDDGPICVENELGKQLHASVRTPNLETSFKLLATGADPNYFHDEKGTTALHVAVKGEQYLQIELLLVYGADPTCLDAHGKTPIDYAKSNANKEVYNRLLESQFEVTDSFSFYLTVRKPDHQGGVHILIPQNGFYSNSASLEKLQKLPNHLFEELVIDVFDEVDRRQTEAIWLSCVDAIELNTVPFLPVDPTLSTTRNQGRQKLARFSTPELKNLVYDILVDSQRRQSISDKTHSCFEEDPVYDTVASDEEYDTIPSPKAVKVFSTSTEDQDNAKSTEILELTKQLKLSDDKISDLKAEVNKLKACVENLTTENTDLRYKLSKIPENSRLNGETAFNSLDTILMNQEEINDVPPLNGKSVDDNYVFERKSQRPSSMYETRDVTKGAKANRQAFKHQLKEFDQPRAGVQNYYSERHSRQPIELLTSNITKSVQQLWQCLNNSSIDECIPKAEKVKIATAKLIANLPREMFADITRVMLDVLPRLQPECKEYVDAFREGDVKLSEHHLSQIREYAYVLVRNTREILAKSSL